MRIPAFVAVLASTLLCAHGPLKAQTPSDSEEAGLDTLSPPPVRTVSPEAPAQGTGAVRASENAPAPTDLQEPADTARPREKAPATMPAPAQNTPDAQAVAPSRDQSPHPGDQLAEPSFQAHSNAAPAEERPLPPPPPRFQTQKNPSNRFATWNGRHPEGIIRPISVTLGLGPGLLNESVNNNRELTLGLHWALRAGFGIAPNWQVVLAWQGTTAHSENVPVPDGRLTLESFTVGAQAFLTQSVYVRGGLGTVSATLDDSFGVFVVDRNLGFSAALGYEFIQAHFAAVGVEIAADLARVNGDIWQTTGAALTVSLF